jgi:hypothetical protein
MDRFYLTCYSVRKLTVPFVHAITHLEGPAKHAVLLGECDTMISQFAQVPVLRDAILHRDALQRDLDALNAETNFTEIASVGTAHLAAMAAVRQQPLSEEDYLKLKDRHAALVQKVTLTCEVLADAEDYDAVTVLGVKLNELKALNVSALPSSAHCHTAVPSAAFAHRTRSDDISASVVAECDAMVTQFANVSRIREAILHRNELQNTLTALRAANSDFAAIGQTGKALKATNAVVVQVLLSATDYLTMVDRHAALVQQVTTTCAELARAGEYDALDTLAAKLEELKALDTSVLPHPRANDRVQPPAPPAPAAATTPEEREVDGPNNPVYVPHAAGASQQGTVPPACTAISVTAEEEEEEWANDPVYLPPAADESTLA